MEKGLPFPVKITNPETIKVLEDIIEGKNLSKEYDGIDEMFEDLVA
jgi:antitoxin component of RelBE/YafQ-DinJ toxin-antitoxin module